ncbi:hypothetical protein ACFLX2_01185 [Candidatus Dependentiae bacterium]
MNKIMVLLLSIFFLGVGLIWFFKKELDERYLVPQQLVQERVQFYGTPQVEYRVETAEESFNSVMLIIKSLPWFQQHGYHVVLPAHEEFKKIYENPKTDIDEDKLKRIFLSEIYDKSKVLKGALHIVQHTEHTVKRALKKFSVLQKKWGFVLLPKYEIVLSPFGIAGFYEWWTEKARIVLLAHPNKTLDVRDVAASILHEMVHVGTDKIIVEKYKLSHWQKERLVDLVCMLYLKDVMPYYHPDDLREKKGDRRVDAFVDYDAIVDDLPAAIEKFANKYVDGDRSSDEVVAYDGYNLPAELAMFAKRYRG